MNLIGAQLYTVRNLLETPAQTEQTLARIRDLGYDAVQLFGDVALAKQCCEAARKVSIPVLGILTSLEGCEAETEELFALCREYGLKDIGISSSISDAAAACAYIPKVNAFAQRAREAGFTFSYHNHGYEFIRTECGKTVMELFLEGFQPGLVDFMPDTYWIHDGGFDVRHFLELARNRVKIVHLKDLKRLQQGHTFAEIGSGNLYFPGIVALAAEIGAQALVVEQDLCDGDPLESLEKSIQYIKTIV